ncbi:GNAT family N-acetyltransferase [Siccirubricoccus sp. G192]|uniref:GNAT family N-acetyltransferase n=1 Tax=Siccirubricoccus sp. G192 TaxID=2849651 RepID=UPI001C2BBF49|nr:GNAT family N-acetyltransferase [Siccirubricoccus sp. G192]MBV1798402.1 GNAT family N-acetyltransferase [Siccirubricoccus sp. G192]
MPRSPDAPLHVEEATGTAGLEQLRPDWARLWAIVPSATPFQSPDWLIPWWRHIGEGELLTLAIRESGELVGLLPFYIYTQPGDGGRRLFPLGIGTTDYLDALVAPGREREVMALGFQHLAARRGRFEFGEWPQLRPGSPLLEVPAPAGWSDRTEPAEPCPILHLPQDFEALGDTVSRKTLRDLRTHRKRAELAGATRWESASAQNLEELFEALLRLHAARWATREEAGVLASPAVQAAHRAALPGLLRSGMLRFHALRLEGAVVAVLYALADPPGRAERRLYFYLSGFDPALERLSPGMLLVGHAIEQAIDEGIAIADFLRGQERYKYFWGAQDSPTFRRVLAPPAEGVP